MFLFYVMLPIHNITWAHQQTYSWATSSHATVGSLSFLVCTVHGQTVSHTMIETDIILDYLVFCSFSRSSHTSVIPFCSLFSLFTFVSIISPLLTMTTNQRKHIPPYHSISNPLENYTSVEEFFNAFNLMDRDNSFSSFTELQQICHVDRIDQWEKVTNLNDSVECHFYLASFLPSAKEHVHEEFEQIEKCSFPCLYLQRTMRQYKWPWWMHPQWACLCKKNKNISPPGNRQSKRQKDSQKLVEHDAECLSAVTYF